MVVLNERGDINAASVIIYSIFTILIGVIFKRNGFRDALGYIYILLFTVVKVIGGIMTVYVQATLDLSLYTPAAIIGVVVLSPVMLAICFLIMPDKITIKNFRNIPASYAPKFVIVTRIVITSALCIGIAGGLLVFTTHTTPEGIYKGQILLRTAAGLALSSWILIYLIIYLLYPERHCIGLAYPIVAYMVMPAFAIRLAYGMGVASTFHTNLNQSFNPLGGSWVIYMCMAFLPEVFVTGSLVGIGLVTPDPQK
ncbi:hypothetical protein GcM3_078001 [Golovinomyces cichoracearum]|uniref:DUF7702 domain-containing protein n=1 Tax=Golovinomyces cichoracearum TaxID=62708 RepID=A0A420IPN7_9PEZI|nr:hypothetical protein GcM3_078001 [Golovinomyces cichoracearum]